MVKNCVLAATFCFSLIGPAFAGSTPSTSCKKVDRPFLYNKYEIIVIGGELAAKVAEIKGAVLSMQTQYSEHIGKVDFSFSPLAAPAEKKSFLSSSDNVYVVCEERVCSRSILENQVLIVEWRGLNDDPKTISTATGHIARAMLARIQDVEGAAEVSGPALLSVGKRRPTTLVV